MKTNSLKESFLTIRKATHRNGKTFYSNSNFFNEEIIVNIDHEKIVITHVDVDTKSKTHKPTCVGSGYVTVVVCSLEYGKYKIDPEESDEDRLVIYYKEQAKLFSKINKLKKSIEIETRALQLIDYPSKYKYEYLERLKLELKELRNNGLNK